MQNILIYEIFGYIGGVILAIALLPQLHRIYVKKSVEDLSIYWISTHLIGVICIIIYSSGLLHLGVTSILPVLISISVELLIAGSLFIIIILTKMNIIRWHQDNVDLP